MRIPPFVLGVALGLGLGVASDLGCGRSSLIDDVPSGSLGGSSGSSGAGSSGGSSGAGSSGGSSGAGSSGGSSGAGSSGGSSGAGSSGGASGSGGSSGSASCSFLNCPQGCCLGDQCFVSTAAPTGPCGSNGEVCATCGKGDTCFAGGCVRETNDICSLANCNGCCFVASMPFPAPGGGTIGSSRECFEGSQDLYCGSGGAQCQECAPSMNGGHCVADPGVGGHCDGIGTCNATNCAGCCAGNLCAVGTQNLGCGLAGAACQDCSADGGVCLDLSGVADGEHRLCGYECLNSSPPTSCKVWCKSATDCSSAGDVTQLQ